jgi:selenide,water dikinase
MAEGCGLTFVIEVDQLPLIAEAERLAVPRYHSRASKTNVEFLAGRIRIDRPADDTRLGFVFDPQTSGGLLIAIDPATLDRLIDELRQGGASAHAVVGRVVERAGNIAIHLV